MDFVGLNCRLTSNCVQMGWPIGTMPDKTDEYTHICIQHALQGPGRERKA